MEQRIRIFILSDNRLLREALSRIFMKKGDVELVGSRRLGVDAATEVLNSEPDVLLLDSAEFLSAGAERIKKERKERSPIRILMVAMNEDEDLLIEVIRRGAYGCVPKEASAQDVVNAVRFVAHGEAVCPPRLCKLLFDLVARLSPTELAQPPRVTFGLTRREDQLIPLIELGLTNKEIAKQLNLSEKTVKNHVHRILCKVGVESRLSVAAVCRPSAAASSALPRSISRPLVDPS